jgi:hypothetical protein
MAAQAVPFINGILPAPSQSLNEALEYAKILKLRDEVFAGSHPRLTVPAHAQRTFSPRPPQLTAQASLVVPPAFPPSTSPSQLAAHQHPDRHPTPSSSAPNGVSAKSGAASEFDPVLLTKSDEVIKAEIGHRRQRAEKILKDQFEQKRMDSRKKPNPAEAKPDFDITTILAKALEMTTMASGSKDDASASDSFDENSLYSSRAPDSTPERGAPSPSQEDEEDVAADATSGRRVQSAVMGAPLNADADEDAYVPPEANVDMSGIDDDEEEGEYSPPEAAEQDNGANDMRPPYMHDGRDPRMRPLRRYSDVDEGGNMRIVRNHITSPAAPQPSRVSPLALAKDAPLQNTRARRQRPGQPISPELSQQYPARKKRKLDKNQRRRRNGMSPDVKEENVSPPPFHEVQPLGSGKLRTSNADRPIVIDDGHELRYEPVNQPRYVDSPARPISRQEPMMPLSEPRASSRLGIRVMRDDQDLRRVASMHNMRAEQPREYVDRVYDASPTQNRVYRQGSPMLSERTMIVDDGYDRTPLQEVRVSRTPAPVLREVYDEPPIRYQPMPPPPIERIVVDQYGRRFREIIQPERQSVAPRAMSVRPEQMDPTYETYRGGRSGSVFVDAAPPERRPTQEMPPPPPNFRQVAEPLRAGTLVQGRDEYDQGLPRSASVQVGERLARQPVYVNERGEYQEPLRMASVRPSGYPYDDGQPRETVRAASVRPAPREGTVVVDEQGRRREYLPVEQPRYRVVEPEEMRYIDAQGREVRTVQRY